MIHTPTWPMAIRIFCVVVALWSAIQVGFLGFAFTNLPPSDTAELVFRHHETAYVSSLVFHCVTFFLFGSGSLLAGKVVRYILNMPLSSTRIIFQLGLASFCILPAVAVLVIYYVSTGFPRYEVFIDPSARTFVREDTHLLPPGLMRSTIPFDNIRTIEGKLIYSGWWGDRYFVSLVTLDWHTINVAQGPRGGVRADLDSLARDLAERSGAKLDINVELPRLR